MDASGYHYTLQFSLSTSPRGCGALAWAKHHSPGQSLFDMLRCLCLSLPSVATLASHACGNDSLYRFVLTSRSVITDDYVHCQITPPPGTFCIPRCCDSATLGNFGCKFLIDALFICSVFPTRSIVCNMTGGNDVAEFPDRWRHWARSARIHLECCRQQLLWCDMSSTRTRVSHLVHRTMSVRFCDVDPVADFQLGCALAWCTCPSFTGRWRPTGRTCDLCDGSADHCGAGV